MALTTIYGTGGSVTLPSGFAGEVISWSGTINVDEEKYQTLANQYKSNKLTGYDFTGAVEIKVQFGAANSEPIPAGLIDLANWVGSITLTAETGCTLAFTGNMSNPSFNRSSGVMTMTINVTSDGAVTVVWAVA